MATTAFPRHGNVKLLNLLMRVADGRGSTEEKSSANLFFVDLSETKKNEIVLSINGIYRTGFDYIITLRKLVYERWIQLQVYYLNTAMVN